jgi:hypothetical protein
MRQIRSGIYISALAMLFACIEPFTPEIGRDASDKLVVSGRISSMEGWQVVNISLASPVENANYIPVSNCEVNILDDKGHIFAMEESLAGEYSGWIGQEFLVTGNAYRVSVVTPDGERIESAYDTLMAGAALDTVYYSIEDVPTNDPAVYNRVMQFYTDLRGTENDSRFYRWEITETWEFHSAHPATYYYNGKFHEISPPDYSKMICWTTELVKNIYTLSTENLSQNVSDRIPLHYIDGHTSRLGVLYSILVTQQSLTESTYNYFEVVRENSAGFGGLYEKQPFSIRGNLLNLTSPEKDVLGYFYATSVSSKRYFFKDIEGLELDFWNGCTEGPVPMTGWQGFKPWTYPVYYYYTNNGALLILTDPCVDCRLRGGTLIKPDFWPY